jgi:hypothetical protein
MKKLASIILALSLILAVHGITSGSSVVLSASGQTSSYQSSAFTVSAGWRVTYSWNCAGIWPDGGDILIKRTSANTGWWVSDDGDSGTGTVYPDLSGSQQIYVFSSCAWQITVYR